MNKSRRWLRNLMLGSLVCIGLFIAMLATPLGRVFDRAISGHYNGMTVRYLRDGKLSWGERVQFIALYKLIAYAGYVVSPEGSAVISHFLWEGKGKDLYLTNTYIRTSPVITEQLATMKVGEVRRVSFKMAADYRLACALNPLNLRKEKDRVVIWQRIVFAHENRTYTRLEYGLGSILLLDAATHTLKPTPFTAYCSWNY
ncbi:hypothetical protein [Hymenobacter sp. YC55]|uniref:hypothetical protein n=1 Tax=Hymenobacter sp. YC55 TaxID=3034019 RepID=UPI0023F9CAC7|nr:hypothetical protein [Hymenobacter sp. YC55]MDF7812864.1 hypothetical protein [Hymenobacter sp. YC55]